MELSIHPAAYLQLHCLWEWHSSHQLLWGAEMLLFLHDALHVREYSNCRKFKICAGCGLRLAPRLKAIKCQRCALHQSGWCPKHCKHRLLMTSSQWQPPVISLSEDIACGAGRFVCHLHQFFHPACGHGSGRCMQAHMPAGAGSSSAHPDASPTSASHPHLDSSF